jgi:hypothetical protein
VVEPLPPEPEVPVLAVLVTGPPPVALADMPAEPPADDIMPIVPVSVVQLAPTALTARQAAWRVRSKVVMW